MYSKRDQPTYFLPFSVKKNLSYHFWWVLNSDSPFQCNKPIPPKVLVLGAVVYMFGGSAISFLHCSKHSYTWHSKCGHLSDEYFISKGHLRELTGDYPTSFTNHVLSMIFFLNLIIWDDFFWSSSSYGSTFFNEYSTGHWSSLCPCPCKGVSGTHNTGWKSTNHLARPLQPPEGQ